MASHTHAFDEDPGDAWRGAGSCELPSFPNLFEGSVWGSSDQAVETNDSAELVEVGVMDSLPCMGGPSNVFALDERPVPDGKGTVDSDHIQKPAMPPQAWTRPNGATEKGPEVRASIRNSATQAAQVACQRFEQAGIKPKRRTMEVQDFLLSGEPEDKNSTLWYRWKIATVLDGPAGQWSLVCAVSLLVSPVLSVSLLRRP